MTSLVEVNPVVLEKMILQFVKRNFLNFVIISPLKKDRAFHLNKLEFPSPKDDVCQFLIEICPVVLEQKNCECIFANLYLSPLGNRRGPSFE